MAFPVMRSPLYRGHFCPVLWLSVILRLHCLFATCYFVLICVIRPLSLTLRHSCFGGTYTVNNMKSIGERDVIFHRRLGNVKDITFDHNKPRKKKAKNRAPITAVELTRRSTLSIRVFLREFCVQLLENCYNPLMYAVKVRSEM